MEKEGLLLIIQLDHLTGEEIGWAMESLCHPGIRNKNLIPTLTKKGRTAHLLMLDIDSRAEGDIANIIYEKLNTYGYHRIQSTHVHHKTVLRRVSVVIRKGETEIAADVRLKRDGDMDTGTFFVESDDLLELYRMMENSGIKAYPRKIRRAIEVAAEMNQGDTLRIQL